MDINKLGKIAEHIFLLKQSYGYTEELWFQTADQKGFALSDEEKNTLKKMMR